MYDAKLSSRSVIHDSAGSAGRTMAEDLENPEDKVRDNTISVRRSKQFMRTVTAPARSPRRTSHRLHSHRLCGGCAASRAPATHCHGALHTRRTARKTRTRRASRAAAAGALWPHRRRRGKRWSGQRRHVVASLRAVASLRGMLLAVRALPRVAGDALAARMRAPCIGSSLHVVARAAP